MMEKINSIKKNIRFFKFLFLKVYLFLSFFPKRLCGINHAKTYLILKSDGLGDLVLWTPYSLKLRKHIHRQNGTMILVTADFNVEIARKLELADIVIALPRYQGSSLKYLWECLKFYHLCGTEKFEKIAQATLSNAAVTGYLIEPLTAGEKLSLVDPTNKDSCMERFFNHLVDTGAKTIHERYQLFFQELTGLECDRMSSVCVESFSEISDNIQSQEEYITVCIGGSFPQKRWPWTYWSELLRKICRVFHGNVSIIGDVSQWDAAEKIIASLPKYSRIKNCCGKYSIVQLYPLLRNAQFTVSMDTGPAHIAAAVGGTVFVICGNGDRGIFFPYPQEQGEGKNVFSILPPDLGCSRCRNLDAECLQLPTFRCISAVSPSQVFNVVNEFLRSLKKC